MENLQIIRSVSEVSDLIEYLKDKPIVAVDTETDGVHIGCRVIGISVCAEETAAFYIVVYEWDKNLGTLKENTDVLSSTKLLVASLSTKQLVMHNALFDVRVLKDMFSVDLMDSVVADTMVMSHLLDEEGSKGLKDLGAKHFGADAVKEQQEMKASVIENGGEWSNAKSGNKEMFKACSDIMGKYGAKDALITFSLFVLFFEELNSQNLINFFFEESMPLLKGPTRDLNETGLKIDVNKLKNLRDEISYGIGRLKSELLDELSGHVKDRGKFSLTSSQHMAWLLFIKLQYPFRSLNDTGRALAKLYLGKVPYTTSEKFRFIKEIDRARSDKEKHLLELRSKHEPVIKENKRKMSELRRHSKKFPADVDAFATCVKDLEMQNKDLAKPIKSLASEVNKLKPEKLIQVDKDTLKDLSERAPWIKKLLKLRSEEKILGTYVDGILNKIKYGVINPRFNQTGTPTGRYSSYDPNFQNLPRDDKRIKSCVVSRAGKVFVGADHSQLEPRVFTSISQDPALLDCFDKGADFYSVVGVGIFDRHECSTFKDGENSFANTHPEERQVSKNTCLAVPYGTTARQQSTKLRGPDGKNLSKERCQEIIDDYFEKFPAVRKMMLDSHNQAKTSGVVHNLFGRCRRLPKAKRIQRMFPGVDHSDLDYKYRGVLNQAVNFRIQSTAASIMNRGAIKCYNTIRELSKADKAWLEVKIILQAHDELVLEGPVSLEEDMKRVLKDSMENTVELPGVKLVAVPKSAFNLADLK